MTSYRVTSIADGYIAQAGALNTSLTIVAATFGDPTTVTFYMHA
jgi:hypothetical protein